MHFELTRELIAVAQRLRSQSRRSGIFDSLERTLRRNFYDDKEDAIQRALKHQGSIESAKNGDLQAVLFSEPADAK
jgi:DNA sulfur modification protein DndC